LQSEHLGPLVVLVIFCATSLPPGVRIARMRDDLVLYEWRPGRVTLLSVILNNYKGSETVEWITKKE
jgi:hypothetical protein